MTGYRLYAHKNSYAMTTHLMLEELGIEYEVVWFNVHRKSERPPEFLALNPNGRVPVLVTPDGPVYESAATLMHLAEHHEHRFLPATGRSRDLALQWLFYLMSTLQPEVLIQFHPERYFPDHPDMQQQLLEASMRELKSVWKVIDDALTPGPWFLGDTYSICDILFVMQALWKENQPRDLSAYPRCKQQMEAAFARPAVKRVIDIHDIRHLTVL